MKFVASKYYKGQKMTKILANQIKVISFDLWRTIFDINPVFDTKRTKALYSFIDDTYPAFDVSFPDFESQFKKMKQKTERKSETTGKHIGWEERISQLFTMVGLHEPSRTILIQIQQIHDQLALQHPPKLMSYHIQELFFLLVKSGRKIVITSNTGLVNSETAYKYLTYYSLNKYIKHCLFSDKTKVTKPSSQAFQNIIDYTKTPCNNILHVGDNKIADYIGARSNGLQAFHLSLDQTGVQTIKQQLLN